MKKSIYKSYDELPIMLNVEMVKDVLGISLTSAYELIHEKDFPSMKVGNRIIVPKDKFRKWVEKRSNK
ncbi:MAG: helix-turn-helix domain-containing protein [Clostridia bacterium]|nr:helix-turn-helix domain-containing protein [Clostridia bacterium]